MYRTPDTSTCIPSCSLLLTRKKESSVVVKGDISPADGVGGREWEGLETWDSESLLWTRRDLRRLWLSDGRSSRNNT